MKKIKSTIAAIAIVLAFVASFVVPLSICDSFLKPINLIGANVNQNLEKYLSVYLAIYFGWFAIIFIIAFIWFGILLPGSMNMRILSLLIVLIALSAWCIFGYSSYYNFDKSSSLEIQNNLLYDIELLNKSKDTQDLFPKK